MDAAFRDTTRLRDLPPEPAEPNGPGFLPPAAASAYRSTELATATPRRLREILYDSAIHHCRRAIDAIDADDLDGAARQLASARRVVRQLHSWLTPGVQPALCREFSGLYETVHRQLIEADFYRRREAVRQSLTLLSHQKPAWSQFAQALGPDAGLGQAARNGDWVG
jgi:flagellar biosynthetic protein FliS